MSSVESVLDGLYDKADAVVDQITDILNNSFNPRLYVVRGQMNKISIYMSNPSDIGDTEIIRYDYPWGTRKLEVHEFYEFMKKPDYINLMKIIKPLIHAYFDIQEEKHRILEKST